MYDVDDYASDAIPKAVQKRMDERQQIKIGSRSVYPGSTSIIEKWHVDGNVTEYTDGSKGDDFTQERQYYKRLVQNHKPSRRRVRQCDDEYRQHDAEAFSQIFELTNK